LTPATVDGSPPAPPQIWRIRDRAAFTELRRRGRRCRSGPLDVVWIAGPAARPPRLAFAIGRRVGPAVVRNKLRRRLRAVASELAVSGALAPGDYLVAASPAAAAAPFTALRSGMTTACASLRQGAR
jgi:ribonuclease P protein component